MTPDPPRVVGRYEIVRELGRGGMATVHLARQPALDREVALKELHPAHAADAAFAGRFLQESRLGGALNHPSVVSVIEYFEHEGAPFIAMEYLERGSLRPLVGRLTLAHVAGVLENVLGGLAEAAAQGIVHRDLKPENVLLTAEGHAKVADFGIAKALGQVQMTELRTATGQVIGTPAYMAPEQVMGGEITPAADLYATGLIAYELLAGRHPYEGVDAPMALMLRHANDEPPPLGLVREDLPPGVVAWVHAMLAKEPAARPASAAHAWDWLEGVVSDELGARWRRAAALPEPGDPSGYVSVVTAAVPVPAPRNTSAVLPVVAAEPSPPPPEPAAVEPPPPASPQPRRPRRLALLAGLAATLVTAAGAAGFSLASGEEPRASAAPLPPQGPSLAEQVRDVVAPALRANRRVTAELTALVPGSDAGDALERANAALPVTRSALAKADVPDARKALRAQVSYLGVVRDTLQLDTDDGQLDRLGGASARLVSRLERIDPLVPRASASVGGAQKLKAWATAELAPAPVPVAPVAAAPAATPTPAPPVATPTPTPIPTPVAAEESAPQLHPRRARLRERLNQRRSRRAAITLPGA